MCVTLHPLQFSYSSVIGRRPAKPVSTSRFRRWMSSRYGTTFGSSASASSRANRGISSFCRRRAAEEAHMATYVLLTRVTSAGVKTIQSNPRRIKEVNSEIESRGCRIVAQYATLGRYDFVNIVEAKDNETIAKVSANLGARGTVQIETMPAIPVETFIRAVGRKGRSAD